MQTQNYFSWVPTLRTPVLFPDCPGVWLWQRRRRVQTQQPPILLQEPKARTVDYRWQPTLQLLPLPHVRKHHGPKQPSEVRAAFFVKTECWEKAKKWHDPSAMTFIVQGARAEHLPVPSPLWWSWIHHTFGFSLSHIWQHFTWTQPQEGLSHVLMFQCSLIASNVTIKKWNATFKSATAIFFLLLSCARRAQFYSTSTTWPRCQSLCLRSVTTASSWNTQRTPSESSCTKACVCLCPLTTPCSFTTQR